MLSSAQRKRVRELRDPTFRAQKDTSLAMKDLSLVMDKIPTIKGEKGDKGDVGPQGPVGERGEIGPVGERGEIGPRGLRGEKGEAGLQGLRGEKGDEGDVGPQGPAGKDGDIKNVSASEVRDLLEVLPKGEKLSIQAIEDLAEIIEELRKKRKHEGGGIGGGGGITSPIYVFVDDETLTGSINGSNTVFYTKKTPYPGSLKVYRGGARQRVTEDYTLSNHETKITFLIAPVAGEKILADYRTI